MEFRHTILIVMVKFNFWHYEEYFPNSLILFLESDEELFEDNPEEYIRKDIEGSGKDCHIHR